MNNSQSIKTGIQSIPESNPAPVVTGPLPTTSSPASTIASSTPTTTNPIPTISNSTSAVANPVPTGVHIIAVLHYISAYVLVLFGWIFVSGSGAVMQYASRWGAPVPISNAIIFVIAGIIVIGFGVLSFFIGKGLWDAKPWARIITIVFTILGIVLTIVGAILSKDIPAIINIVPGLIIGVYLLFSKKVKEAFSKK